MSVDQLRPQPVPVPEIRAGAQSAKGLREENQDAMTRFQSRYGEVILVADGMGGHQGGAVASDMVAQRFRFHLDAAAETPISIAEALQQAAARVNDEIYERGHSGDPAVAGMGSTLVVAVLKRSAAGQELIVANAGDSRGYLIRDGMLRQLTKDHTAAQRMVDAGMLSPADARVHPQSSVLSRALGQQIGTTVETYPPMTMLPGDGLLLCSDGLSGYAQDPDITAAIESSSDPNIVVRNLVDLALSKGSDDNITVQFLRLGPPSAAVLPPPPPPPAQPVIQAPPNYHLAAIAAVFGLLLAASAGWYGWRWWQNQHPVKTHDQKSTSKNKSTLKSTLPLGDGKPQKEGDGSPKLSPQIPEGDGTAPAAPPSQQPSTGATRNVMLYLSDRQTDPGWLPQLQKLAAVRIVNAETDGPFAPDRNDIVAWYRKSTKADFDRLADKIPDLRDARRVQDDSIPAKVDILIVMPRPHR